MTLHSTAEGLKKGGIVSAIGLGTIILLVIFFRVGVAIKTALNPPRIDPPNQAFGKIPALEFPQSTVKGNFTYSLETLNGNLPDNFPDRLIVYPITQPTPSLNDLKAAKTIMQKLGFLDIRGLPIPEASLGGPNYEWTETSGFQRQMLYDIVTHNYTMTSNYLASNTVLRADSRPNAANTISATQSYLAIINGMPDDIDIQKTMNPDPNNSYNIKPTLYSIYNGQLVPAASLAQTQAVRVDLYQRDITYSIVAGQNNDLTKFQTFPETLPILYPHPPFSTMNFIAASTDLGVQVVSAIYSHQTPNLVAQNPLDPPPTYPIKTADEAYKELQNGKGYIGAYSGTSNEIPISNVYLAYYLGETKQSYLMPIIVFEGQNGFYGFVSAIKDEALQ